MDVTNNVETQEVEYLSIEDVSACIQRSNDEDKTASSSSMPIIPITLVQDEKTLEFYIQSMKAILLNLGISETDGSSSSSTKSILPAVIAIDCEWRPGEQAGELSRVSVLQVATNTDAFVCDLHQFPTECTLPLIEILESPHVIKLGKYFYQLSISN